MNVTDMTLRLWIRIFEYIAWIYIYIYNIIVWMFHCFGFSNSFLSRIQLRPCIWFSTGARYTPSLPDLLLITMNLTIAFNTRTYLCGKYHKRVVHYKSAGLTYGRLCFSSMDPLIFAVSVTFALIYSREWNVSFSPWLPVLDADRGRGSMPLTRELVVSSWRINGFGLWHSLRETHRHTT